jgi:hypothetical protein
LAEFNPSSNETCPSVFNCGSIRTIYVVFKGGEILNPFHFETLKQILTPLKDLAFQWPPFLFTHPRYGLVFPCCLMVEGQVHHIKQIVPSLVDVPLNTLQLQLTHCHHIDRPNGRAFYPCGMK